MIESHFSAEQIAHIREGVRKYIRLIGFIHDPNPLEMKWLSDEWDLYAALETVGRTIKKTESLHGKRKYQGIDFDIAREVKKDMHTFLLSGRTEAESAGLAKRNQPMYYLVICPVIDLFASPFDQALALEIVDEVIRDVQNMIWFGDDYGDLDDAVVARAQVMKLIRESEEKRIAELNATKRKRKSKRNPIAEMLAEIIEEEEPELALFD